MKPMPKSLHTVTVIVKLAKFARGSIIMGEDCDKRSVDWALAFLGYSVTEDTYDLAGAALKQLKPSHDL